VQKIFLSFVLFVSGFALGPLVAAGAVVSDSSKSIRCGETFQLAGALYKASCDEKGNLVSLEPAGPSAPISNKVNSESISSSVSAEQAIPGGFHGQ